MPDLLYLDTARVGQIAPSAHRALTDYLRLNADQRFPLYFDAFFEDRVEIPESALAEYNGISCWQGLGPLKDKIRRFFSVGDNIDVWFSGRSISLMRLAAEMMFRRCRNIMVPDLTWPSYKELLVRAIPNSSCRITRIKISDRIGNGIAPDELVDLLVQAYAERKCDGLFFPLVSNLGIRLPIRRLVERIRQHDQLRFVVLDIAQAVNHVPIEADKNYFDFAIGGTHKWFRSFLPLGFALSGNPRTCDFVSATVSRWVEKRLIDDPLLRLVHSLEHLDETKFGETVDATPLIACAGALSDANQVSNRVFEKKILQNVREQVDEIFGRCGLSINNSHPDFHSRILTYTSTATRSQKAVRIHHRLEQLGIATSMIGKCLRISIPPFGLSQLQLNHLASAVSD